MVGAAQSIKKVQKSLKNDVITDIDFFGNWLGIRNEDIEEDKTIAANLAKVPQYEIIGGNLVSRIDEMQ